MPKRYHHHKRVGDNQRKRCNVGSDTTDFRKRPALANVSGIPVDRIARNANDHPSLCRSLQFSLPILFDQHKNLCNTYTTFIR